MRRAIKATFKRDYVRRQLHGFTITEVVVSSLLLAVAIVPILKALTSAQVTSVVIEQRTRGLVFAQSKLEEIKARSIYHYNDTFAESNTSLDGRYLCSVQDTAVSANLREITVTVGYDQNANGVLASDEVDVTLTTLLAKRK